VARGSDPNDRPPSSGTSSALEFAVSFLSTWFGVPRAPGSVTVDPDDPLSLLGGETNGRDRVEAWIGQPFSYLGPDSDAYQEIAEQLTTGGHGMAAIIVNGWPPDSGTGTHAWNACNYHGRVQWIDAQQAAIRDTPIYPEPHGVWALIVTTKWMPPT
jgi:hypothetical protein